MCSFIYGYALSAPILGKYFELPKKNPINHKIIFDEDFKSITDVCLVKLLCGFVYNSVWLAFQVFAYRYIDTEKYVVKHIQPFRSVDDLLEAIKEGASDEQTTQ